MSASPTKINAIPRGLGVADIESGAEVTPATPFGIASLTKIVTATALARLEAQGTIAFDDPVIQHLPSFTLADAEATETVTVGHLLSHTGGWADFLEPVPGEDALESYASQLADIPQIAPAGTQFSYSNSGYLLAGAVTEQVTGEQYESTVDHLVLQPLGMANSMFATDATLPEDRALGHQLVEGELIGIPPEAIPRPFNPVGGLVSSIEGHADFRPGARLDRLRTN
ncbi:MAG: beta-lactamase family protein [Thermomicrobiales bacterium]|nr:beta-lactamase family protein [Thermomicrobiales bacterium]